MLHVISWLWSSVCPNPTVLASVMLYTPVGPEGCGAFTGWGNDLVLCTKIKTYKFCSTAAHLGQVITRAIPHRSINFRISQLFTQFPLIWFSNFEFLEPRKLIFYSNYILFHSLCCLLKSATQSSHTTPHPTSSAMPLVQHTQSEIVFWRIQFWNHRSTGV